MLLSIVTLNYKKTNTTLKCIKSLYAQLNEEFKNNNLEVIIVNIASEDGSVKLLEKTIHSSRIPKIRVLATAVISALPNQEVNTCFFSTMTQL